MQDDQYAPAPLTPKQKRILRIALSTYLIFMGIYTLLIYSPAVALFYAILTTADFYLYINISGQVRIKKK
jgi:hypothetical protein